MPGGRVVTFDDPDRFQASFRAGNYELLGIPRGQFEARLTHIDLSRLKLQRSDRAGPGTVHSASLPKRIAIMFLADAEQAAPHRNGIELSADDLVIHRPGSSNHLRAPGPSRLAMMSLEPEDLAEAALAITGREFVTPLCTHLIRPAPGRLARLRALYAAAHELARTTPDAFSRSALVQSLDQQLVHAMVSCVIGHESAPSSRSGGSHAKLMNRFEDFLSAHALEPVYLAEICAAIGASERTLRSCCQDHLGMGPIRYLWLRRMNLAHRALLRADPARMTVTDIATEHGFWELGRFSVEYRALFGESPSASLRRPREETIAA
jgi:AraC-like DNA-binding protein